MRQRRQALSQSASQHPHTHTHTRAASKLTSGKRQLNSFGNAATMQLATHTHATLSPSPTLAHVHVSRERLCVRVCVCCSLSAGLVERVIVCVWVNARQSKSVARFDRHSHTHTDTA